MSSQNLEAKIEQIKLRQHQGFAAMLGIKLTELSLGNVQAELQINADYHQPFGIMHGGVSLTLAETVASIGAWLHAEENEKVVGVELNANHLKAVTQGLLVAIANPIHIGRRTQVWSVNIKQGDDLICVARCTLMLLR